MTVQESTLLATHRHLTGRVLLAGAAAGALSFAIVRSEAAVALVTRPWVVAILLTALVTAGALVRRPLQVILPLMTVVVYANLSDVLTRNGAPSLLQPLIGVAALICFAERKRIRPLEAMERPLTLLLALYSVVIFASSAWARAPSLSDARFAENARALAIFVLVVVLAFSWEQLQRTIAWLVTAAGLLSLITIYQFATRSYGSEFGGLARVQNAQIYADTFEPRVGGPFGDPNFFAQILLISIPLAVFAAAATQKRSTKVAFYLAAVVTAAATLLTYSRGAVLALAVMTVLTVWSVGLRARYVIPALALIAMVAMLAPRGIVERMETVVALVPGYASDVQLDSSMEKRKLLVSAALDMFERHPGRGVGAGNFTVNYDESAAVVGSAARQYDDPGEQHFPHNLYLEIASETGFPGLMIFLSVVATAFGSFWWRRERIGRLTPGKQATIRGLEVALAGYLVSAVFLHAAFQRQLWVLFGLMAAAAGLAGRPAPGQPAEQKS